MAVKSVERASSVARAKTKNLPNKHAWFWTVVLAVFALDQFTKVLVRTFLRLNDSVNVLPFFRIVNLENVGITFGLFKAGMTRWFVMALAFIVIAIIAYYYKSIPKKKAWIVGSALILAGATGNLVDRILYGPVTDFLHFGIPNTALQWPAFNVADSALTVGALLLLWLVWKKKSLSSE